MTPEAAIYRFMAGFGIPAYAESSTPSEAEFPYLTYQLALGEWGAGETNMQVNLWYYGDGETAPNAKARELFVGIGLGGKLLRCDGGALWVKRGSPWSQAVTDPDDDKVRRRLINVSIETLTDL